jgi:hypothetical protein
MPGEELPPVSFTHVDVEVLRSRLDSPPGVIALLIGDTFSMLCRAASFCLSVDFVAGTGTRPELPEGLDEHLTVTADGLWVVWAHKLARRSGSLFVPLRGGAGYPADAKAECRRRGRQVTHTVPDPECTCGFHALSSRSLPGLPFSPAFAALTVALSGRVLAFEWAHEGVLWRAERQTVVRIDRAGMFDRMAGVRAGRRHPGDPDGRLAAAPAATPHDSGPVRLSLPASAPVLPVCHDDAGWCVGASTPEPASLVLA